MKIVRVLAGIVIGLFVLGGAAYVFAGFHDGPLALIPGGPLVAGELVEEPVTDWGFAKAVQEIELQLAGGSRSRTTWIVVNDDGAFIPCSLDFPPGKEWHLAAEKDGRGTVRILGKRYPITLKRVADRELRVRLKNQIAAKYSGGPPSDGESWFFRIDPGSA